MNKPATALIADDEPLLREELAELLSAAWPSLRISASARNGREAVELFEQHQPTVCFLDVQMPGMSGIEAARHIGRRAHIVFVTAFEQYAVQAFAQGVLDYLVKPVETARLAEAVARVQERLGAAAPVRHDEALLRELAQRIARERVPTTLRWVRAQVGTAVRLIAVDRIDYLQSDSRYTLVAWRQDDGSHAEALVSLPLKDLLAQLDAAQFVQIHRSTVVNLERVSHIVRGANETADVHLKGRSETLRSSRNFNHIFRQM
ncbi:MAG: LytTR family DNA-binding domain-containing protein [Burkholderiaceae bacterium]|jgi:DNA-binding LytR/AlgR family response regulator|nr:LytTR family DNA-binding domain-containing protein [Burkholderiaceae bacterium]MCU0963896.1 LytTR family DNA-binding domain-containing protein [Burkholderiaceae bacterium]